MKKPTLRFWRDFPLALFLFFLVLAPQLATHDPIISYEERALAPPSHQHWLGTDRLGRDEWSRLVVGGRTTLASALLATSISVSIGLLLASIGRLGAIGEIALILKDALLAFPAILIALVLRSLLDGSWFALGLAVGVANIANYAHVALGAYASAAKAPHLEGARSIGASRWRILSHHLIPTALPTLTSFAAVVFAWSILYGSALAFLGLGEDPSTPEWGMMIQQGQGVLTQAPRLVILPSVAITGIIWLAYRLAAAVTVQPK